MPKVKATTNAKVKKKPVKMGSKAPKNIGGILNYKLVAIAQKRKKN